MDYIHHYDSPLGGITLASDGETLKGLWFDGQKYFGSTFTPFAEPVQELLPVFEKTVRWLDIYFNREKPGFLPPLSMQTTPFRRAVWEMMLTIPYGQTMTYGEIAGKIAGENDISKTSARAVGNAVGHNPISLIIPCHRVLGAGGKLAGYAGGVDKKIWLLEMEKGNKDNNS